MDTPNVEWSPFERAVRVCNVVVASKRVRGLPLPTPNEVIRICNAVCDVVTGTDSSGASAKFLADNFRCQDPQAYAQTLNDAMAAILCCADSYKMNASRYGAILIQNYYRQSNTPLSVQMPPQHELAMQICCVGAQLRSPSLHPPSLQDALDVCDAAADLALGVGNSSKAAMTITNFFKRGDPVEGVCRIINVLANYSAD
ncbi:MAG: hypothetical protein LBD33_00550 [Puniceicoccales bacterium]|jgi:hypothetical protein|nr:hypothetical protein [Puniceicoccales bacterium]